MKKLIILILLINTPLWAQSNGSIEDQRKALAEQRKKNDEWEKAVRKNLSDAEEALKKNSQEMARLSDVEKNRKQYEEQVILDITAKINSFTSAQKILSKRASFYRCIRSNIKDFGVSQIPRCRSIHPVKLEEDEEAQLSKWNDKVGLTPNELKVKKSTLEYDSANKTRTAETARTQVGYIKDMKLRQENDENQFKAKEADILIIQNNQKYVNCDADTPDISLEEKVPYPGATFQGPFVGVPRDNQDGLGTCYANAAKNLLVGVSQGKDVASFLDIALAYKGSSGVVSSGLDAGESCSALNKLNEKGFCPQFNAPVENGERNVYMSEGLLKGASGSVYDQAIVIKLLQKFVAGREVLEKNNKDFSEQVLRQSKAIVHNIKMRPNIIIPLPIVRHPIPSTWKFAELHAILHRKNQSITFDDFNNDYQKEYRKFYPIYVRGVIEGKSRDEIFEAFKTKMAPFIDKYQIAGEMKHWKNIFMQDTQNDVDRPTFKKDLDASVDFLKVMSGKSGKSTEEFLKFCEDTQGDSLQFLSVLQPLIKHLNELNISTDELYDADGKFRDPAELMQLSVAPACLHADNRKKFSSQMSCDPGELTMSGIKNSNKTYKEKVKQMREKVVASLIQGYPLGNTFQRHINTIVGMRFNKELSRCEYKIRESQNGTSTWQSEGQIFDVIRGLTEVRRK